jgi:hypothetical protein
MPIGTPMSGKKPCNFGKRPLRLGILNEMTNLSKIDT